MGNRQSEGHVIEPSSERQDEKLGGLWTPIEASAVRPTAFGALFQVVDSYSKKGSGSLNGPLAGVAWLFTDGGISRGALGHLDLFRHLLLVGI